MSYLIDKKTREKVWVDNEDIAAKGVNTKLFDVPEGEKIVVEDPHQGAREYDLGEFVAGNARGNVESTKGQLAREQRGVLHERYGGVAGGARATLEGLGRGATLGGSDVALRALGVSAEDLRGRQEEHPELATGAEIVGALAPALASGGGTAAESAAGIGARLLRVTPAGYASRISGAIAGEGAGLVRAAAGLGAEGAVFGGGTGISELALSSEPITAERVVSTLSSKALYGGLAGAGTGIFVRSLELGMGQARKLVSEASERFGAAQTADDLFPDLAGKSRAELQAARRAEVVRGEEALAAEQRAAGGRFAADLADAETAFRQKHAFLVADDAARPSWGRTENAIRKALRTPEHLADNPGQLSKILEERAGTLKRVIDKGDEVAAKLAAEDVTLASKLDDLIRNRADDAAALTLEGKLAQRYSDFADIKLSRGKPIDVSPGDAQRFRAAIEAGEVQGARSQALGELQGLYEQTQKLRSSLDEIAAIGKREIASPRLSAIENAIEGFADANKKGRVQQAGEGVAHSVAAGVAGTALSAFGVPIWAAAPLAAAFGSGAREKLSSLVFRRAAKASSESSKRTAAAIEAVFDATRTARRVTPVAASKVLSNVSFGAAPAMAAESMPKSKNPLVNAFREREREIRAQVAPGPDGQLRMTMQAREEMAARLAGLRATDPLGADRVETVAARRLEFLANKLPRRPGSPAMVLGPDKWRPSDFEMAKWARYVAAVEDPDAVVERIGDASISPEDVEALRSVYPEKYADAQMDLVKKTPEIRETVPYQRQVALSIFFGVPVGRLTQPEMVAALQRSYSEEPGAEQGMSAPKAQPQFGSLSKPEYTASQRRQMG